MDSMSPTSGIQSSPRGQKWRAGVCDALASRGIRRLISRSCVILWSLLPDDVWHAACGPVCEDLMVAGFWWLAQVLLKAALTPGDGTCFCQEAWWGANCPQRLRIWQNQSPGFFAISLGQKTPSSTCPSSHQFVLYSNNVKKEWRRHKE